MFFFLCLNLIKDARDIANKQCINIWLKMYTESIREYWHFWNLHKTLALSYGAKLGTGMLWQDLKTDDDYGKLC